MYYLNTKHHDVAKQSTTWNQHIALNAKKCVANGKACVYSESPETRCGYVFYDISEVSFLQLQCNNTFTA